MGVAFKREGRLFVFYIYRSIYFIFFCRCDIMVRIEEEFNLLSHILCSVDKSTPRGKGNLDVTMISLIGSF